MKKKIFLGLLIFLILGTATLYYASQIILPVKLKKLAVEKMQEALGRPVTLDSVHYSLFTGCLIKNLTIFDDQLKQTPLLSTEQASFNILYLPLFRDKKIIVPSMTIQKPSLRLIHQKDNSWNFSDIISKPRPSTAQGAPFVFVGRLNVIDGKIEFTDRTVSPNFTETLDAINLKASLLLPKNIKYRLEIGNPAAGAALSIIIDGQYDLISQTLTSRLHLNQLDLLKYSPFYSALQKFHLKEGALTSADLLFSLQKGTLEIQGTFDFQKLRLAIEPSVEFSGNPALQLFLQYDLDSKTILHYQGTFNPQLGRLTGIPFLEEIKNVDGIFSFNPGQIKTDSAHALVYGAKVNLSGLLTDFKNPSVKLNASLKDFDLKNSQLIFFDIFEKERIDVAGLADAAIGYSGALNSPRDAQIQASVFLRGASLATPRLFKKITNINGTIIYETNLLRLEGLNGTMDDTAMTLSGVLKDFADPAADLRLSVEGFNLSNLPVYFPEFFEKVKMEINGVTRFTLDYKGRLSSLNESQYHLTALLEGASFKTENLPEAVTDISGTIELLPNQASWENLRGSFKNSVYAAKGALKEFNRPHIETQITSENFELTTAFNLKQDSAEVSLLKGRYFGSTFEATGQLGWQHVIPIAELNGTINLNLKDLTQAPLPWQDTLTKIHPEGTCQIRGSIKTNSNDWRSWQLTTEARSPSIALNGCHLSDIVLSLSPQQKNIYQLNLSGGIYDGKFDIASSLDLSKDKTPYQLTAHIERIDLSKLKNDTIWKDKEVAGRFSTSLTAKGLLEEILDSHCEGSVLIQDGYLWQLDLLKGLGQLFFISDYKDIVFKEGKGDFLLEDHRLSTNNFELISDPVTMMCAGWVDFEKNIDFDIAADFNEDVIAQSPSLKIQKTVTALLTQGGDYISVKITGTTDRPNRKMSLNVMKKAADILKEGLKNIFQ